MYFVTIVTQIRASLFGAVVDGEMRWNRYGEIVRALWFDLPRHYRQLELGAFVSMSKHVHGIIILNDTGMDGSSPRQPSVIAGMMSGTTSGPESAEIRPFGRQHGMLEIVRAFEAFSAHRITLLHHFEGTPVWQRNYYEHIIRNQQDLELTWPHVESNPAQREIDNNSPAKH